MFIIKERPSTSYATAAWTVIIPKACMWAEAVWLSIRTRHLAIYFRVCHVWRGRGRVILTVGTRERRDWAIGVHSGW